MIPVSSIKDLVVLTADGQMQAVVKGLLARHHSLGIRPITFDSLKHPQRDAGCRVAGTEFLSIFTRQFHHAILMFDWEGCGETRQTHTELEKELEGQLSSAGWSARSAVIIINPELENWIWVKSNRLPRLMGWDGRAHLQDWLAQRNFIHPDHPKPWPPKEAMEAAMREKRKSRTSAHYADLAQNASFRGCTDQAFLKFKRLLVQWFT
jgi:hypothetical protein